MVDRIKGPEVVVSGDTKEAERAIESLTGTVNNLGKIAKAAIAVFATAALASFFEKLISGAQSSIDVMSKMSRQNDATVLGIQALRRAADLSGVSLETLTNSAKQLNVSIGEMTTKGTGPAVQALKNLGLTADSFKGLDIDQKFGLIADRMKKLNLTAAEQQAVLRDLRIEHATVQNLLENGSKAFSDARNDVIGFGQAISDVDAVKVEMANDAMTSLGEALKGVGIQIAVALAPFIKGLMAQFDEWAKKGDGLKGTIQSAMDGIISAIGPVADAVALVSLAFRKLFDLIKHEINKVVEGFQAMADGIRAAIAYLPYLGPQFAAQAEIMKGAGIAATDGIKAAVDKSVSAIREGLGGKFPSERLQEWVDEVKKSTEEAAQSFLDQQRKQRETAGTTTQLITEEQTKRKEAEQAAAQSSLDSLLSRLLNAEELEMQSYQRRLSQLVAFYAQGRLSQEEYHALLERNEEVHNEKMYQAQAAAFQKSQQLWTSLASQVDTLLGNITTAIGAQGKKQFAITKALSVAQAVVKGYEAVVSSYAAGAKIGGPPIGALFAGIAAASTAAQIAALRSTNENSGSAAAASAASDQAAAPTQTLILSGADSGQIFTGDALRGFLERVGDYVNDGGKRVVVR